MKAIHFLPKHKRRAKIVSSFVFFFLLVSLNNTVAAASTSKDSLKTKYGINDPKNPRCPCHYYQRLAQKEFDKLEKEKNKLLVKIAENVAAKEKSKLLKYRRVGLFKRQTKNYKHLKTKTAKRKKKNSKWLFGKEIDSCFKF
jgi:hypothetical protein